MAGKFLIVDSDPQICQVIVSVAKAAKITPVVCGTLADARTALKQHVPDLALVADQLPDGPGTTMLTALAERCPDAETVMMVSGDQPELVAEAMRDGAADFLPRPFTAKQLALVLSRVMKNKAKRRNPAEPVGPCSALILDDEPLTLRVLGNFLAEVGFSVIQASSLSEARSSLEQRVPDVLVSDIFLEADAALDFLREIKHRWPYLPVIVVTGSTQNSILLEAMRAEAYSVLIKPLDKGEFQRVVQGARRLKSALEERSRLQRTIDARDSGLAFLQEMMARAPQAPAPVAVSAPPPPAPPPPPPQDPPSHGGRAGATFDSLPSGIILLDRDRRIVDLNPSTCRLLHVQRDMMIGQLLENVRELEPFQAALLQTLATGQTFTNLEATLVLGTTHRTFGYNTAQLLGTQHEGAALIYFQDITAKKKVEQHMRATERLASVGLLAAGVTNEISTPLTVAMGHSEMLLRYAGEPERVARHVEKIQEALRHASEFTTKLMRLVKQPEESAKPTDLNQALNEAVHLVDRKLRLRSQQLETAFDAIAAEIIGDPIELQQVFLNLLSAASDRTPGGGTLKLVTSNLTGVVEIAIQDSGLGLQTEDNLNATAELDRPMGSPVLGLAISRNIVSRFGGVIRSEVEPGRGTTVTVRFPMVSATLRKQWVVNQSSRVRQLESRGRSAVVLADPGGDAMAVKQWLEEGGQPVELRSSAETALAPLASGPPAVYVVDGAMHSPDWITFLRAVAELRVAPVVLLLRDEAQRAIVAGLAEAAPTRLVSRPLTAEAVLQAVALAELDNDGEDDESSASANRR